MTRQYNKYLELGSDTMFEEVRARIMREDA